LERRPNDYRGQRRFGLRFDLHGLLSRHARCVRRGFYPHSVREDRADREGDDFGGIEASARRRFMYAVAIAAAPAAIKSSPELPNYTPALIGIMPLRAIHMPFPSVTSAALLGTSPELPEHIPALPQTSPAVIETTTFLAATSPFFRRRQPFMSALVLGGPSPGGVATHAKPRGHRMIEEME
jgi:hypothetical protein